MLASPTGASHIPVAVQAHGEKILCPNHLSEKLFWEQWLVPGSHDFVSNVSISVGTGKEGVVMRVGKFSNIGCVSWRWQTVDLFISAVAGRILATTSKLRFISFARYVSYKCKNFWMEMSFGNVSHNSSRTVRFIGFFGGLVCRSDGPVASQICDLNTNIQFKYVSVGVKRIF